MSRTEIPVNETLESTITLVVSNVRPTFGSVGEWDDDFGHIDYTAYLYLDGKELDSFELGYYPANTGALVITPQISRAVYGDMVRHFEGDIQGSVRSKMSMHMDLCRFMLGVHAKPLVSHIRAFVAKGGGGTSAPVYTVKQRWTLNLQSLVGQNDWIELNGDMQISGVRYTPSTMRLWLEDGVVVKDREYFRFSPTYAFLNNHIQELSQIVAKAQMQSRVARKWVGQNS